MFEATAHPRLFELFYEYLYLPNTNESSWKRISSM